MTSLKQLVLGLSLGIALVAAPAVADAHVIHHAAAKHVVKKPAVKHRKHVKKHVVSKTHKPLVSKGLHSAKPLAGKKISPSKTGAGWHHHAQTT